MLHFGKTVHSQEITLTWPSTQKNKLIACLVLMRTNSSGNFCDN